MPLRESQEREQMAGLRGGTPLRAELRTLPGKEEQAVGALDPQQQRRGAV
jgi:hypothetical protein